MENVGSNKKVKKVLCYFGLVILLILLVIPPVFRLAFKEEKKATVKEVIEILSCSKDKESVTSTFLNNEPQTIVYKVVGDYSKDEKALEATKSGTYEEGMSSIITTLSEYTEVIYTENDNISTLNLDASKLKGTAVYDLYLCNIGVQDEYYRTQGFSCIRRIVEQ